MVLGGLHHLVELVGRTTLLLVLSSLLLLCLFLSLLLLFILLFLLPILFVLLLLLLFLLCLLLLAIGSLLLLSSLLLGSFHRLGHLLHLGHLATIARLLCLTFTLLVLAILALLLALALLGSLLYLLDRLFRGLLGFLQGLIDDFIVGLNAVLYLREGALSSVLLFLASSLAQGSVVIGGRFDVNLSLQAGRTNADGFGSLLSQREAG